MRVPFHPLWISAEQERKKSSRSRLMELSAQAAERVAAWSPAKRAFAAKITGDKMLDLDSDAARELVRYATTEQQEKSDLMMRLLCRRFEVDRLRMALAEIADPTLNADECRKIARTALDWKEAAE